MLCADNVSGSLPSRSVNWLLTVGQSTENGEGIFTCIRRQDDTISFETDEGNGRPVFWIERGDWIIVTSDLHLTIELCKNVGIGLELQLDSASEFLIAGCIFTGKRTLIRDVHILPPRSLLRVDLLGGKIETDQFGGNFSFHENSLSKKESVGMLRRALELGFSRHKNKKVAILLSGGCGSRILASTAISAGLEVDFYTFGQSTINASDFAIASVVAHRYGKITHCFSTSAENFLRNWKDTAKYANWANDSIWWAARLPSSFFAALGNYEVILRGDGDGCYGWGGCPSNVSDILHRFEITPNNVSERFNKYFADPEAAFGPARGNRTNLVRKYISFAGRFVDLKGILFKEIREGRSTAPGIWYFSRVTSVDAPLLWKEPLLIAKRLPKDKRTSRWVIFESLKLDQKIRDIPFSSGPSWNNHLEFIYSGVWEELLDYTKRWSPWALNEDTLREDYLKPPSVPQPLSFAGQTGSGLKGLLRENRYVRLLGLAYFPNLVGTTMTDRILIRIAVVSSLCEALGSSRYPSSINVS